MSNYGKYEQRIRAAVGFARESGFRLVNRTSFHRTPKGVCMCPMAAVVIQSMDPKKREKVLAGKLPSTTSVLRGAAKVLGVKGSVVDQFMGAFDNVEGSDKPWPRSMSVEDIRQAAFFDALGIQMRKELRPRST